MEIIEYKIHKRFDNITLGEFFSLFYLGKTNKHLLIQNKCVFINGLEAKITDFLHESDTLGIRIDESINVPLSEVEADVVYEDDYLLIVNKPVGLLIHDDGNNDTDTLVNRVARYFFKHKINRNIRYLHRIDKETSGLVVFVKDFLTYSILSHEIETHELKREYLALVHGRICNNEGIINKPIGRDRHVSKKFRVGESKNSKPSLTHYYLIKNYASYAYIRLLLETGRTHQIRVHMSSIDHPLLGDTLYGGKKTKINRVALHSFRVSMIHPYTQERIIVEIDEPDDMLELEK